MSACHSYHEVPKPLQPRECKGFGMFRALSVRRGRVSWQVDGELGSDAAGAVLACVLTRPNTRL